MLNRRRRLWVAAFAASILAAAGSPLAAQETNTVGPPQLKDFRLPGQRTTPPVTQPQPQPAPPTTRPTAEQPPRTAAPPPASTRPAPVTQRRVPAATEAPAIRAAGPASQSAAPPPAAAAPEPVETFPVAPAPAQRSPLPAPTLAPAEQSGSTWLWLAGAGLLALLGFFGFRRLSAARAAAARRAQLDARAAARAAAAAAAPEPAVDTGPRARLELGFVPDKAVATDSETIVHYDLIIRNAGAVPARNIRIDARMFNASAQAAINAFLKGPIHEKSGSPLVTIAPGADLKLASNIAMPKQEVKGIKVQGLSIFVPIVAINVAYDWGENGKGRTSLSWLVGREPETPSAKMGAFRLDLGPRIYRSVGQRPTELANVA